MKTFHVTKSESGWVGKAEGSNEAAVEASTKAEAVQQTIELARQQEPASVIIHTEDGRFEEERTYPRSADPRRTEG